MALDMTKWVSSIGGALLVVWSLIVRADDALLAHLADVFASKNDLIRIEHKLDQLIARQSFAVTKPVPYPDRDDVSGAKPAGSPGSGDSPN